MKKIYFASLQKSDFTTVFLPKFLLILFVLMAGLFQSANSQVTLTASGGAPVGGPWTTLKAAFDAINAGTHQGNIVISIAAPGTTETAQAVLNSSGTGAALYTSVTVNPTAAGVTVTGNLTTSIVKLNGADNVTINGLFAGVRNLTFTNSSTGTTSTVIWVGSASAADGATNNTISNCIITGTSSSYACIMQSSGVTVGNQAETANSNNTYNNNLVHTGFNGIGINGPAAGNELNTTITNNTVGSTTPAQKFGLKAIQVFNQQNMVIADNIIRGVNSTSGTGANQASGIDVSGIISGGSIEGNDISDIVIAGFWGCNGIQLNSSSASTGLTISNNFIYDVHAGGFTSANSIDDGGFGIALDDGGGYNIYYNSVRLSTNQNSGISAAFWVGPVVGNGNNIRNNIFSNQQSANIRYSFYSNSPNTVFSTINYNDYFNLGANLGFLGSTLANLAALQAATGQDANSFSTNPGFTSATDLHLLGSSSLNALGTPIAGITRDIDTDTRDVSTPDVGADEFTPPNCTTNNGGTASASSTSICASGSVTLSSVGYSFGLGIAYQWEFFNGAIWQPLAGQTNPTSASTGVIGVTTSYRLRVICSAGAPGYSNVVVVTVNNPTVSGTTPGTRCGVGTVNLGATGTNLKWYDVPTGGTSIGTGSPFTTPVISATTTYYVSASVNGTPISGGKPSTDGADGTNAVGGIQFTVTESFVLNSVVMYPTAAGTNTINLFPGNSTSGVPIFTTNVTFAGANPAGVTVPIGWTIPPGSYTIYQSVSGAACWRDFFSASPAIAYPYSIGTAVTLTDGSLGGFYYFFYNWNITPSCEGTRTAVTATVTAPPAISPTASPSGTICEGTSVNLNVTSANAGYTYVWNPGSLSGAAQTVTPLGTTAYIVTATDASAGPFSGCVNQATVNVPVNPVPTPLVVSPSVANVCAAPIITTITATGGLLNNQSIFTELFEAAFGSTQFVVGGSGVTAARNTTYFSQGTSSVKLTYTDGCNGDIRNNANINLTTLTNPTLSFYHICALERSPFDFGWVEYSTDAGVNWTTFPTSAYTGTGTTYNGVVSFSTGSYSDWDGQFASSASDPGAGPATSLWKKETIDLTAYQSFNQFRVRFRITSDPSVIYNGWYIDSVNIKGTGQAPITWSPPTDLYSDAAALIPYVAGTPLSTVYTKPTGSITYTATATGGAGCNRTATSTLTVTSVAVGVTIAANPGNTICAGSSVTFTATPVNGGTTPFYTWQVNGGTVASGIGLNTYTTSTLANTDQVRVVLLSNVGSCASNNPATSNIITMTVNPNPAVNITGATTVCNGAPPTVLTANATIASGSIATYEWFLGGVSQGAPAPGNTFNATLPGTYTVTATSAIGCPTTSAAFVVTLPTYTITASAGPNGTISPSGSVVVNCGDNQTFTITPNGGFAIQDVIVDGVPQGPIGTYTFTNVTANGHTISATFFIAGCPIPPTANAGANASFCANQTYTLNGAVGGSATAGTWSGGTGTYNPNANTLNAIYTPSAAEIAAGTVTLTLTSNNPGGPPCVPSTSSVTLTIKEVPVVSISGVLGFCVSGSTTLTASATINPAGPITYQWTFNPGNVSLGTALTQTSSQGAGTYAVTATGNGCSNSASEIVALFASPTVSISGSNLICTGTPTTLSAIAAAGSGVISSYQWKLGGVDIGGATSPTFATTLAGNYTLQVTNSNGCSTTSAVHVLAVDNSPLNGNYTIGVGPASCTNYISFASAINDLNTRTISGNVRFDVPAGYTETVPFGGLGLGSVALNATVAGRTISFLKNGVGANPLLSSYTGGTATPSTNSPDGIFSLRGVDNVSIDRIDLLDVNTTNPATMEYGYGLFKLSASDGAQNNTISNCNITLSRVNNGSNAPPMFEGSTGIAVINGLATAAISPALVPSAASGTNSNNKFYGNTIVNCNNGIGLGGYAAASPFTLGDTGNDVGGSSIAEGNTILNFGGGGIQPAAGIRANNQWGVNISFNTINNNNGSGVNHPVIIRGIYGQAGTSANATINNNNIDIKGGGTNQIIYGIDNSIGSTAASNTITINNNIITAAYSTVTTGGITAIVNSATASTLNMSGNTVQNITQGGTGPFVGISNNAIVATVAMNDNIFTGNTITSTGLFTGIASISGATNLSMNGNTISSNTKTNGIATTLFLLNANASTNSTINNNTITGNTVIASATNMELAAINQGLSIYTANNNFISNNSITGVSGTSQMIVTGYRNASAAVNETVNNNTIRKLFITGTSTNLQTVQAINLNTGAASVKTISGNIIDSLYTGSGLTANIYGIRNATGTTVNIFRNKIHSLHPGQSALGGSYAAGIRLSSGSGNIYNNMIGLDYSKAFAPAANSIVTNADGLKGIEFTGTSGTWNIYFNSIHLKGAGGTGFGSSAISQTAATSPTLNLRNNILDNQATPNGGRAVAFRRGTNALGSYASTSNNNSFYAGTASANNLLYFDITNAAQTIAAYQGIAGMSPRESASIASTTAFVDPPYDLHLDPANNCDKDASGAAIPGYTTDYDGDTRNATAPDMGCDEFDPTGSGSPIWKGVNTDWTDVVNWCGAVPISTTNVSIPAGRSNYPTITTNTPVCGNINIASGGSVTITGVGQLAIYGTITNAGTFNVADGTIEMAGSSAQTIPASTFVGNNIKNLIINNATVNLGGALNLTGKLSFTGSNRTFATAGNLTLKSSATATASVGDITNNGTNTGNQITGDVLVERHIMAVRAWRLLSPPTQHNLQTIKEAWQENQAANATTPAGFGIQITSDRASWSTDGFDLSTPAGSSVKTYNPATNQYVGLISTVNVVAPTASNGRFEQGKAYMTFIRGDRTVNTFPQAPTTTVLREKGALITNNFVFPGGVGAGQFAAVGNPYASAIDFSKVYTDATNIQNVFYLWDPQLGTLGGYRTFSGPSYNPIPAGGSYTSGNKFIESGSGFFVHSSGPAGTVTLKETHKVDGSYLVTRTNSGPEKMLYTNLYQVTNGTSKLFDGVLNEYDPSYADGIDEMDGIKLNNFGETLGLTAGDKLLVIDRKSEMKATDTIFYKLGQVKVQNYQFEFIPQHVNDYGVEAFLEDVYLNTKTPVSLTDTTRINFNVINEPGSYDANRFRMVFKQLAPVPVTFTDIRADKQQKNVLVSWKVENEVNIREYAIEKSADGRNFTQVATKAATGNNGASVSYSWLDVQATVGANFYRVRSLGQAGDIKLSRVVKATIEADPGMITVYPNPVKEDRLIQVSLTNMAKGVYQVSIINETGQTLMRKQLNHPGGNSVYPVRLSKGMAHGNYNLELTDENNTKTIFKVLY